MAAVMINSLESGIVDYEAITPGQGYGFMFSTGANPYALNSVDLEEVNGPAGVQVGLNIVEGDPAGQPTVVPVGTLGNPTFDPRPTQLPNSTAFIDYSPVTPAILQPNTAYLISVTEPVNGANTTAITFGAFEGLTVSADWSVDEIYSAWIDFGPGPPGSLNGWVDDAGGDMKIEIDATPAPEASVSGFLLLGCGLFACHRFRVRA